MVEMTPLHLMDVNTLHDPDFVFQRKSPSHDRCLLMLFRTAVRIDTQNGRETASPGDFIINTPDFPWWHASVPGSTEGFRNDWLYASATSVGEILKQVQLPVNVLLSTGQPVLLEPFVRQMMRNCSEKDRFCVETERLLLSLMLIAVARAHRDYRELHCQLSEAERCRFVQLRQIREWLRNNPEQPFDIQALAERCSLSPERFTWLFRHYFSVTPFADLMNVRNLLAQQLLIQSDKTIQEIAQICGWRDHRYFDRVFRKANRLTPSEFRARKGE